MWDRPQIVYSQVSPAGPEERAHLFLSQPWSFLNSVSSVGLRSHFRPSLGPKTSRPPLGWAQEVLISLLTVSLFPQNLFNSCHVEERAPPRSDFLAMLKKSPELVRISVTPASGPHVDAALSPVGAQCHLSAEWGECLERFLGPASLVIYLFSPPFPRTAPLLSVRELSVTSSPLTARINSMSPSKATSHLTGTSRYVGPKAQLVRA